MKTWKTLLFCTLALGLLAVQAPKSVPGEKANLGALWLMDQGVFLMTDLSSEQKNQIQKAEARLDGYDLRLQEELSDRFGKVYRRIQNHEGPATLSWMQALGPNSNNLYHAYRQAYLENHWDQNR